MLEILQMDQRHHTHIKVVKKNYGILPYVYNGEFSHKMQNKENRLTIIVGASHSYKAVRKFAGDFIMGIF